MYLFNWQFVFNYYYGSQLIKRNYMKMNSIKMKWETGLQFLYFVLFCLVIFTSSMINVSHIWEQETAQWCACSKSFANCGDRVKNRNYCSLQGKNNYNSANLQRTGRCYGDGELRAVLCTWEGTWNCLGIRDADS